MPAAGSDRELAILARNVSKQFLIPEERRSTLKERALHPRKKIGVRRFEALNNINFDVERGEFYGIAGRNGSGKSTLLKCVAGIYSAQGKIWRIGSMSTMIELGVGFNMELAARDNVILNGIMLGLSPREARRRYDAVIDFAELRDFQDLKVKNYSSGMLIRLAFATAVQVDADVMLVDEILAVGDAAFQQKCFDVFNRMRDQGKTIIFVTHDMGSLVRFCHRAMLLENGEQVFLGDPQEVADRYLEINFGRQQEQLMAAADSAPEDRAGDGDARVMEVWMEDAAGERLAAMPHGERCTMNVRVRFNVDVSDPNCSVYVHNEEHRAVTVLTSVFALDRSGEYRAGDEAILTFAFLNVLAPGRYNPVINLAHAGEGLDVMDRFESNFSFVVTSAQPAGGLVDLPVDVTFRNTRSRALPAQVSA